MKTSLARILMVIVLITILGGCANNNGASESSVSPSQSSSQEAGSGTASSEGTPPEPESATEYADIYTSVFDSYFEQDPGLHDGMKYIAIDMDTLEHATEEDIAAISDYFREKYSVDIMDASFEDLREQGLVGDGNSLEGILLYVDSVDAGDNEISIEGTKFRSGLGANGFVSTLENEDGVWVLKETTMAWIS